MGNVLVDSEKLITEMLEKEESETAKKVSELEIACFKHPNNRQIERELAKYKILDLYLKIQCLYHHIKSKELPINHYSH